MSEHNATYNDWTRTNLDMTLKLHLSMFHLFLTMKMIYHGLNNT